MLPLTFWLHKRRMMFRLAEQLLHSCYVECLLSPLTLVGRPNETHPQLNFPSVPDFDSST
jgi:hypothetical protein